MTLSIRKILLPVTLEDDSRAALLQAAWLARHFGAELVLLHVAPPNTVFLDQAWDGLDHGLFGGLAVTRLVRQGHPARRIVDTARAEGADLILLATHGRWRSGVEAEDIAGSDRLFQRFVIHAVAAQVIENAPCPVWACPSELDEAQAQSGVRHVLCHIDLKSRSRRALDTASAFAAATGARLSLAHATASTDIYAERRAAPHVKAWAESFAKSAAGRIATLQTEAGTEAEVIIENGEPPSSLEAAASRTGADVMIVLHWQAPNYWEESSSVFDILRHARIPVLVFGPRPPQRTAVVQAAAGQPWARAHTLFGIGLTLVACLAALLLWAIYEMSVLGVCADQAGRPTCKALFWQPQKLPAVLPPRPVYHRDPALDTESDKKPAAAPETNPPAITSGGG